MEVLVEGLEYRIKKISQVILQKYLKISNRREKKKKLESIAEVQHLNCSNFKKRAEEFQWSNSRKCLRAGGNEFPSWKSLPIFLYNGWK